MNIITVGLSHKTAPVELRELLAVPASRIGEALKRLMNYSAIKEGMLLQTCNRVEVYAVVEQVESGFSAVQEFLVDSHLSLSHDPLGGFYSSVFWRKAFRRRYGFLVSRRIGIST